MGAAEQGTPQWHQERVGHCTASRFKDVLAEPKKKGSGESVSRRNYRTQLVTERLTGVPLEGGFRNASTDWGTAQEALARQAVEIATGHVIMTSPFVLHPKIEWCGASPDGLIGADGLTQIKCPFVSSIHLDNVESGGYPSEYRAQIQGEMWVTGRQWSLFVSFDPRMPEHLRLHTYVVKRDEEYIKGLSESVIAFLKSVKSMHDRLTARRELKSA